MKQWIIILLCILSTYTSADDVEIYTNNDTPPDVKTNMLMVYDLSSSMNRQEPEVLNPYDSGITYSNASGLFAKKFYDDKYYVVSAINNGDPAGFLVQGYSKEKFHCESMKPDLAKYGWAADRFSRHGTSGIPSLWTADFLGLTNLLIGMLECREDASLHGNNGNPLSNKWAKKGFASGANAWTNNEESAVTWNDTFSSPYAVYEANYMRWYRNHRSVATSGVETRLQILQNATKTMVDTTDNINIGLISTNRNSKGGSVDFPLRDITAVSEINPANINRDDFNSAVDNLHTTGFLGIQGSPLTESVWEAYAYYSGGDVHFGDKGGEGIIFGDPIDRSVDESRLASNFSKYESPITESCQVNAQVIFTDGAPTFDSSADNLIEAEINALTEEQRDARPYELSKGCGNWFNSSAGGFFAGFIERRGCLSTLGWHMNRNDVSALPGDQQVKTFAIGGFMRTGLVDLRKAAQYGGGKFYTANDAAEVRSVLDAVLVDVLDLDSGFAAPAVSVNAFNTFSHSDEIYYALFKPKGSKRWQGNLKKYKLGEVDGRDAVLDKFGVNAVNEASGVFNYGVTSYWSTLADGPKVEKGGAASNLVSPRILSTYLDDYADLSALAPSSLAELSTSISKSTLGDASMTDTYRQELINYAQGINQSDITMGDSIHSSPVTIIHGGTEVLPVGTTFVGTNNGFIHGIDIQTGATKFSFIPKDLLPNLNAYFLDQASTDKVYGMDGPLIAWTETTDGGISSAIPKASDKVTLLAGMRRGGRNYYALDLSSYVHNTNTIPKLKWVIQGGQGDFSRLGQTWAEPKLIKMKINGVSRNLLMIMGGYDPTQDTASSPTPDSMGNAIYLVDPNTGQLVWSVSPDSSYLAMPSMTNGFVAQASPIDLMHDGHVETIFAADVGGRLWRFDFNEDNTGTGSGHNFAKGGIVAQVSGTGVGAAALAANNRRFFGGVSVALAGSGSKQFYTLAIGSGFRPKPMDETVQDRFYVFVDNAVGYPSTSHSYTKTVETDLHSGPTLLDSSSAGWYLNFRTGEKMFDKPITFDGNYLFTTFRKSGSALTCGADLGTGAYYLIDQVTGAGALGPKGSPKFAQDVKSPGIPPGPTIVFRKDKVVTLVGKEVIPPGKGAWPYQRTGWYEEQ